MTPPPNPELRSPRSHRAILDSTFELAVRNGYGKLTVEAIAAAAGVGKQTIYRWWPSKGAIALDAINEQMGHLTDFPDTGDIAVDLKTQMTRLTTMLGSEVGIVYRGVIAEAQSDPRLAEAVRDTIVRPRAQLCVQRLEKAIAAGQIRTGIPPRAMVDMLYGPVYYRFLLGTDEVRDAPELVQDILSGLRP
ncbi:TetR/AcrR family transcriptional regulator [Nocardia sp. NBC_01503]|uniref:TetR/AcrR family transcriptional regulator n=1 Tax=Nocardia sp. NBC_01503 TaxID=2975997 RepID=UPI002E7B4EC0|nr:TetR/AcrR family transcriptional regulator [Nocardia sp. NBC_01503]WTL32511.1 TetR/AcrR family transcriptional regulator [Nocardia sp. NBC_01503]